MDSEVTYRWLEPDEHYLVAPIIEQLGWMRLNPYVSRVRAAFLDGQIVGFQVMQLVPSVSHSWTLPERRAQGVAEQLADDMVEFFRETDARGWLVVADSPHSARLCEQHGMHRVMSPVYVIERPFEGQGGVS